MRRIELGFDLARWSVIRLRIETVRVASSSTSSAPTEKIVDQIPVVAKLAIGREQLRLILTSKRIIIAHVGKRGLGAITIGAMIGVLANVLESVFMGGRESGKKRKMREATPEQILLDDKGNFSIGYSDIIRVELTEAELGAGIIILTRDQKLQLSTGADVTRLEAMFDRFLGDRVALVKGPGRRV